MGLVPIRQHGLITEVISCGHIKATQILTPAADEVERRNRRLSCFKTQLGVLLYNSDTNHLGLDSDSTN